MSQFSAYKKETQKGKPSKKRDTAIGGFDLEGLKANLDIFKEKPVRAKDRVKTKVPRGKDSLTEDASGSGIDGPAEESGHSLAKVRVGSGYSSDESRSEVPEGVASETVLLTEKQHLVYSFFVENGVEGTFNRTIISQQTGVTKASVKAAIVKFQKLGMIQVGKLCPIAKIQTYRLNSEVGVAELCPDDSQTIAGPVEISEFWERAGLSLKKCEEWLKKIPGLTPERLQLQLEYGEHTDSVLNAEKGPVNYLFGCLNGNPLIKPAGYRTTEDKYLDIMKQHIREEEEKARELEKLKEELLEAKFKTWCLEHPDEVKKIHENSSFKGRDINGPAVQAYIKNQYRKMV